MAGFEVALTGRFWVAPDNMSEYFDRNKDLYIDLLLQVSSQGAWSNWIEFCLEGVVEQAQNTARRCEGLITLSRQFHERVSALKGTVRLTRIIDDLFIHPIAVVARIADRFEVTYPTARSDLKKLSREGILTRMQGADQITYFCGPIVDLTYRD